MNINGVPHHHDKYGFLKQSDTLPFDYSAEYKARQGTTVAMAYLRMAVTAQVTGICPADEPKVLEVGPGSGAMLNELAKVYGVPSPSAADNATCNVFGHDIGELADDVSKGLMLSDDAIKGQSWDILFACDVIEHFPDIDHLWDFDFAYAYLSFPCPPDRFTVFPPEKTPWHHFKPNEHIYYLERRRVLTWIAENGYEAVYWGNPEDLIRRPKRHLSRAHNISSVIIKKK